MTSVNTCIREVRVERNGHCLSIDHDNLERIGGPIAISKRVPSDDASHGYDVREELEILSGVHSDFDRNRDPIPNFGLRDFLDCDTQCFATLSALNRPKAEHHV